MTNQRRVTALVVIAVAAIIAAGGLMASNMGFKLNYPLQGPAVGLSNSGTQTIGLPYNRQVGVDTASALLADINASGITATQLQRYDPPTDQNSPYPGPSGDFGLQKAEGYLVKTLNSGDYIIVGSHDPSFTVQLKAAAPAVSNSGTQRYAHPYHGVAATASELLAELTPSATQLQRYDPPSDQNSPYPGPAGDFALVPGEAYLVKVISDKNFVPAHY